MSEVHRSSAIRDYLESDPTVSIDTPLEVELELEGVSNFLREFGALGLEDRLEIDDELVLETDGLDKAPAMLLEMTVPEDVQNLLEGFEKLFVDLDPPDEPDGALVLVGPGDDLDGGRGGSGGSGRVPSLV